MLHERRAPGNTCLSALDSGWEGRLTTAQLPSGLNIPTATRPMNGSKGCGSVMRVAPVGLLGRTIGETFTLGCQTGA